MPKSAPLQSDFTMGEISPYAQGRVQEPWYKKSMSVCLNGVPMIQGGWTRRPGTKYQATSPETTSAQRIIPFAPKYGSNCMLVLNGTRVFCYQNYVLVNTLNFSFYAVFTSSEIPQVRWLQNGAFLYLFHTNHRPICLSDPTGVGYPTVAGYLGIYDGPYGNSNIDANGYALTATTMTLNSGTAGSSVTLTASSTVGINNGAGFQSSDINRFIRINPSATTVGTGTWATFQITGISSTTIVTGILFNPSATTATLFWTLGLYKNANGYWPGCATIYGGRLYVGGSAAYSRRFDASSLEYDISLDPGNIHFNPTVFINGVVTDASGLDFTLLAQDSQSTCWMVGDERGVVMGTTGDEWTIRPSTLSEALTATNVDAKATTFYGSNPNVAPVKVGKSILFIQRSALKLREMFYSFDVSGYRAPDRTKYAEHITGTSGIVEMVHQREPQSIVWCARADGTMCAMTHEEEDGEITAGWHRHTLGANLDTGSGAGSVQVISVAVLPSADKSRDEVWLLTARSFTNPGVVTFYLETIQPFASQYTADAKFWYLDFGTQVVNNSPTATITGLSLYNGLVVNVWADGANYGQYTVASGQITLPQPVTTCLVGFDYNSDGQLNRMESGSADGAALTKIRRTHRVGLLLQQTLSLSIGMHLMDLTPLEFRTQDTGLGLPQASFSGIRLESINADYGFSNQFSWRANGGAPCTILAVCPRMDTQDAE